MAGSSDKVLLEYNDVFIYKIPTDVKRRKKRSAHRAKDWDLANPDGTYKLTLVAAGKVCHIQLKDENGGLFGQAVIDACPGTGLASDPEVTSSTSICIVADSTRYFTLKLKNRSGEYELVGLGFSNRDDSSTLTKALEKYFGSELRKNESNLNKDKKTAAPISKIKPIPRAQSQKPTPIPPQDRKNNDVRLEEKSSSKPNTKSIPEAKSKQTNSRPENNSKSGKNTTSQSNSNSQPKPMLVPFYCNLSGCTKGFYSEEALLEHKMAKHGQSKNLTKQGPKKPLLPIPPPLLPLPPPQPLLSLNTQLNQYARTINMPKPNPIPVHSSSRKMAGPAPIPLRPTSIQIRRSPPAPAPSYSRQGQWQGQNQRAGAPHGSWSRPQERERAMQNSSRPSNQLSFSDFLAMKEQEEKSKNMEHTFSEQFRNGGAGAGSAMEIDAGSPGPFRAGQQQQQQQLHGGPGERNSPSQYKGQGQHQNQQERLEPRNAGRNEYHHHQGQPPKNPNEAYPLPTETQRFLQSLEQELFQRENQLQRPNQDQRIVYLNEDQHQLLNQDQHQLLNQDQQIVFRNQQLQNQDHQMALFNPDHQMMFLNQDQQMMFLNQDQPMMFLNQDQPMMFLNQDQQMMLLHDDQQLFHNQDQRLRGNHGRNQLQYDDHPQYYGNGGRPENQNRLVARTSLNPTSNLVRSGAPVPLLPVMGRNTKKQKSRPLAPEKGKQGEKQQKQALAEVRQKPYEGGLAYRAGHNMFRCHWCPTTYFSTESEKALQTHWKEGHGLTNPIVCKMCTLVFFTAVELKKHKQDRHVFNCTVCSQECVSEKSLRSHLKRIHDQDLKYACHICSVSFNSKDSFTTHLGGCGGKRPEGRKSRKVVKFPPEVVVVGEEGARDVDIATTQMEVIQVADEGNGAKPMETSQVEETETKKDEDDDDEIQIIGIFESDGNNGKK